MVNLSDTLVQIRGKSYPYAVRNVNTYFVLVACGTCGGIAILTTIFRNFVRIRKSEIWVDDVKRSLWPPQIQH